MCLANMPSTYKKTFDHYIKLFDFIGLNIFEESTSYLNWHNFKLFFYLGTLLPFLCIQISIITDMMADNFMEGVRAAAFHALYFFCLTKMVIAVLKRSHIRDMFIEIGELWPKDNEIDDKNTKTLNSFLRRERLPLDWFLVYSYVNLAIYLAAPFLTSSYFKITGVNVYVLPYQTKSWAYYNYFTYVSTYIWQVECSICLMCAYQCFDLIIATMTLNISALLLLLQEDLKNSIQIYDANKKLKKNIHVSDPESSENIKKVVLRHQRLLRLTDNLNDTFGLVIFIHLVFTAVVICFFGFLTAVYGGLADSIINLMTAMSAVLKILFLSLSGQTLYDASTEVADAAFDSLWYVSDENVRKSLFIIIIRAQSPCYLSALGYSELTLPSFSRIMSSSWTYFSLLIQMYSET